MLALQHNLAYFQNMDCPLIYLTVIQKPQTH